MKMKRILLFLLGGMPMLLSAQSLATKGYAAEEIVPQGVNFVKAEGDLNKDGLSDLVIYAQPWLAIYFATPSGDYEQWKQYDNVLPIDEEGDDLMIDIELSVTDRGALRIAIGSFAVYFNLPVLAAGTSAGSSVADKLADIFRLIIYSLHLATALSINYLDFNLFDV